MCIVLQSSLQHGCLHELRASTLLFFSLLLPSSVPLKVLDVVYKNLSVFSAMMMLLDNALTNVEKNRVG